jgi:diguanylate cyclase
MTNRGGGRTPGDPPAGQAHLLDDLVAQQLGREARHDPLTDLANRRAFQDAIRTAAPGEVVLAAELLRVEPPGAADVPHLDEMVLLTVGARLQAAIRPGDVAARIGHSDLALLLRDTSEDLEARVAMIRAELERPVEVDGILVEVGATLGTTTVQVDDDPDHVLQRARQHGQVPPVPRPAAGDG